MFFAFFENSFSSYFRHFFIFFEQSKKEWKFDVISNGPLLLIISNIKNKSTGLPVPKMELGRQLFYKRRKRKRNGTFICFSCANEELEDWEKVVPVHWYII
ncbi:hypothetical protein FCM35_KLT12146 [Carex littledalei]|uniref:Uncharacterized protein n=1 Tax=Carex littledalei TaxID=544730 RepID=A0A833VF11_9POAL|nr:hypothetical protein FCM35_KLT12146 [Carex littledalei]